MAARSIFIALTRNCRGGHRNLARPFSSTNPLTTTEVVYEDPAANSATVEDEQSQFYSGDDLKSRIFRVRLPKRSATNVLEKWVNEGRKISISDLRHISKELRKSQRYKHALELSEWMISHDEFELSDSDYAVRIDLMTKVFGIDAAERYFEGLPPAAKTSETCTALLHSYAGLRLTDKAEQLYEKIKESNLAISTLLCNELMTLYMSVRQDEKVSSVVEELKQHKVEPDLFTYNLWISSCAAALNIDEVRKILDEMSSITRPSRADEDWTRYMDLCNIYLTSGNLVNSEFNILVESEKRITQREWITYDFLIILYGALGNKTKLDHIWKSLRMTKQKMIGRNYMCIISSYLMLGHLDEVREVIDQWKQSSSIDFDVSICNRLSKAFEEVGMMQKAETLRTLLAEEDSDT